ncbi:MAG TPA: Ig-like domain-containing protein [Steroidobacteraceae bacterium]|nr:Ig-like domain-containing protein [Steroidobacteraceae bacterium]
MRRLSIIAWIGVVALLAGCGGTSKSITGETSSTGTGTSSGTTVAVTTVTVVSNTAQIAADGSNSATISATAKDASNNLIKGATVAFSSTAGGLAITQAVTDVNGLATATLTAGTAAVGTTITVTASSGGVSGNVAVSVVNIQQTITLTTSLPQIPSDGSKTAVITALVRNASNQFIPGVVVNFVPSSGGLAITQGTTDNSGTATATLSAAQDPTNRIITVTATAGTATATVPVAVTGTTLSVVGPPNLVLNGQGTYTVSLLNSSNAGISGQTVTLTSANGNTLSTASFVTDSTGQKSVTLTAAKSGNDTLTATALGLTAGQAIAVSGQSFQFTTPAATSTNVDLGVSQTLTVTWAVNGAPQANQTINFAATRGTLSAATATTNAAGQATVTISSTVAGPATITASATGVTTQTNIDFIATVPASIAVEASPATIPTHGQSTITAVVRDPQNNLVEGQAVDFQTVGDTTGGTLSVASGITDSQGRAQTVYTASATTSATKGVQVKATVQGSSPAIAQSAYLTVGGVSVGLSLGTGNQLTEILAPNGLPVQFSVPYTVIAADAAGNPVGNVPVTLTIHPLNYFKGGYTVSGSSWVQTGTPGGAVTPFVGCINEDDSEPAVIVNNVSTPNPADFNGIMDPGEDGCTNGVPNTTGPLGANQACNASGNGNGKLDPGVTAVASPGSVTTGADGTANFVVNYPESDALWVQVQLIATTNVSGTETSATSTFILPILAKYLTTTTADPPGDPSPYGVVQQCNNPN